MEAGNCPKAANTNSRMGLSVNEVRERTRNRDNSRSIGLAIRHQNRIKFHAQTELSLNLMQPVNDFQAFAKNILPDDKFRMFLQLFRYPVATNELVSVCFDKLSRIFEGRNPIFQYQFTNADDKDDWEWYRTDKLKEPKVWQTRGWEYFRTEINSVLIVDLREEQEESRPAPYFYWLPIEKVLSFKADRHNGGMDYIIFTRHDDKIVEMDDEYYRLFDSRGGGEIGKLLVENRHDLGYCPARFFWREPISLREPYVKASPVTKVLSALDWYLFYYLSKEHLDLYGSYPIYSGYAQACDYSNEKEGNYCDGGFLRDSQGQYLYDSAGALLPCPKCGKKRIIGAGSFVEVPIPVGEQPDLRNPVQMLSVDRSALDYNTSECDRLRTEIITSVVGQSEQITQREAFNEQQVIASFESQNTVLNRIKKGFEEAQEWVDSTVCKLRYGEEFVSAQINYGTEFFLQSPTELREKYKVAKDTGASEAELDALLGKIIEAEYRNDPIGRQRMQTLADLEPYRHLTRDEVFALWKEGVVDEETMRTKLNFASLIRRFERENADILEFGTAIPYERKIEIINQKIKDYVNQSE